MKKLPNPLMLAGFLLVLGALAFGVLWRLGPDASSTDISPSQSPTETAKETPRPPPPEAAAHAPLVPPDPDNPPTAFVPGPPAPVRPAVEPERDPWSQRIIEAFTPNEARIDLDALAEFNDWLKSYRSGSAGVAGHAAAVKIAARRRATLKELIKQDPEAAFAQMIPDEDRRGNLPPDILALLEKEVAEIGDWHVQSICFWDIETNPGAPPAGSTRPEFTFNPDGPVNEIREAVFDAETEKERRYHAFPVRRLVEAGTEFAIPLQGFAIDDVAVFDGDPPDEGDEGTAQAPGESTTGQMDALPFSVKTKTRSLGYRTLLYMRCTFADSPGSSPQSEASAYANLRTANNHMIESSYGRMQMLTTVTPVIVLPGDEQFYMDEGTGKLASDARTAASALGYTMGDYSHRVYRYNGGPGTFGGLAAVGADPGNVWLRTSSSGVAVHEFGHNYGLHHSGFWEGNRKSSIGPGSQTEYGHSHDPMGNSSLTNNQFCSYHKQRIGWLKASEWIDCKASGRYRIVPMDDETVDPGKRYAIKIDKDGDRKYWLEYRRNFTTNAFTNGVLLQGEKFSGANTKASLFDVTYWSKKQKNDATIPLGWTFSDHEHGVHITPVARAGNRDWIDVQVNRGRFPGNQAPVLVLTSNKTAAATSETVQFTASATDADGDDLAYHWYYDDNEFHRNLNQATVNRSWGTAGIYSVVCTVTDMKGGVSVQSIPITVGSPSGLFTVTGNANDHTGAGVRNAPVDNNLAQSDANYRSTITDDNGDYTLTRLIAGSYTFNCRLEGDTMNRSYSPVPLAVGPDATGIDFRAKRVTFSSSPGTLAENGGVATFTIARVGTSTGAFDVAVSFSGAATLNTDFSVSPAPIGNIYTIPSGGANTEITITVTGLDDGTAEGPEDIILAMQPVNNLNLTGPSYASLTIDDDDTAFPRLVLAPVDRALDENGGTAQARITRFGDTALPLTVGLNTGNTAVYDTDYTFSHGSKNVTIPAGATSAFLTMEALDDGDFEGNEPLNITMKNGNWIKDPAQRSAFIYLVDDEIPEIDVTAADSSSGEGNGGTGAIRFTASSAIASDLDVEYCVRGAALHGTDYAQTAGILTIPSGQTFADVVITGLADSLNEGAESATVRAAAHNSSYTLSANNEATVNVNNKPLLAVAPPPADAAELGPVSSSCRITRVGDGDSGDLVVTIDLTGTAAAGADFANLGPTVTIPDGSASVDVDIDPLSDSLAEGDESVTLTIAPRNGYAVGPANQASLIIEDLPIDAWRVAEFGPDANNAAIAGNFADPEGDGIDNLTEFGLLFEPMVKDAWRVPAAAREGGFLMLTYTRRRNAGVICGVHWSTTLAAGTWSTTGVVEEIIAQDAATETVKAKVPVDAASKFMRIGIGY